MRNNHNLHVYILNILSSLFTTYTTNGYKRTDQTVEILGIYMQVLKTTKKAVSC